jgi:integrase/recombinase XerD
MVDSLTIEEREKLIGACKTHKEKLCVNVLLETGLRVSEFANLTPESIQDNRIVIKKKGFRSKKLKIRIAPLPSQSKKLLETHFNLGDGMQVSTRTIQRLLIRVGQRAGLKKVRPQILRNTFLMKCLRRGMSLQGIEKLLDRRLIIIDDLYSNDSQAKDAAIKEYFEKC